jgi:hypothetical protein
MTRRPPGVVVAAVLLGSIALVLSFTAIGTLLASLLIHTPQLQNGAVVRTLVGLFGLLFAGMAAFEWCVMAGLLRTRNWARISTIILGALLALFSSGMIVLWLVVVPAVQNHSRRPLPASAHMMFAVNGVIYGLLTALGIWWVVYFNLRPSRAFFTERGSRPGAALEGGQEPLMLADGDSDVTAARVVVLIYAVQKLLGAAMMLGVTALHLPFFFAGVLLHGEAAFFGYLLFVALEIFIGIGLFRKLRPAYYVAIAFQIVGACSMLTLLAPSVRIRALLYFQEVSSRMTVGRAAPPPPSVPHMQAMIYVYVGILTLVLLGIYVWGLLRDLASLPLTDAAFADTTK